MSATQCGLTIVRLEPQSSAQGGRPPVVVGANLISKIGSRRDRPVTMDEECE